MLDFQSIEVRSSVRVFECPECCVGVVMAGLGWLWPAWGGDGATLWPFTKGQPSYLPCLQYLTEHLL